MERIAIITLNGYFNYGNRLQNYAVQEVLKSLDFSVETVVNKTAPVYDTNKASGFVRKIERLSTMTPKEIIQKLFLRLTYFLNSSEIINLEAERTKSFKEFTSKKILEVDLGLVEGNISSYLASRYDYFITGSDQVWNPYNLCGLPINFLTFVPKEKRIAYSASFGISEIPSEFVEQYREWLAGMHRISVREEAGAKIIKDLTGRDAVVLVDPTMMLTKEKWLSIAKPAVHRPKEKYIVTYFLGKISKENRNRINKFAKQYNLEIISLADVKDKERYKADPAEFIDYINSASLVCTDSFHGVIFSILMETPFIVFKRQELGSNAPSMYSRIDTLLATFRLEDRKAENISSQTQILNVDYSHIESILEGKRKKAIDYLKEALNI